jgi:flagellar biosynthesis/type III secretory pathway M-ring protein FliF/YscJ
MTGDGFRPSSFSRLVSVPGIVVLAVLGIGIAGVARLFGTDLVVREVLIEMIASFGSAILVLAVFGLFFRSGIERLIQRAPGGDLYAQSTERLREMLEELDSGRGSQSSQLEERLARIEENLGTLSDEHIPDLKDEIQELRRLILESQQSQDR